eukprot:TRINITY_DN6306_c0_g1_i1.p1 TRINITY_DN6306_c0_g1~~TRINITY_DN6306_c0_g1_i1.p1  ORF type:complete len:755 (+),score=152.75 TRINITY_DN6306_c0_g1_i1:44-2308(+)
MSTQRSGGKSSSSKKKGQKTFRIKKVSLEKIWPKIQEGLNSLLENLTDGFSFEECMQMYSSVYDYCTTNQKGSDTGSELYFRVNNLLLKRMRWLSKRIKTRRDDSLLNFYRKEWARYRTAVRVIDHIFQYLNEHWIKTESKKDSDIVPIQTLALNIWYEHMFGTTKEQLCEATLSLIEKERDHEYVDTTLVKGMVNAFINVTGNTDNLHDYQTSFEPFFIVSSTTYYENESQRLLDEISVPDYMIHVEKRLKEEEERADKLLHSSTKHKLITLCERILIIDRCDYFTNTFLQLLNEDRLEDLGRMYRLLSRANKLDPLYPIFEIFISDTAAETMNSIGNLDDYVEYTHALIYVHSKCFKVLTESFESNAQFSASLDRAARRYVNDNAITQHAGTSSKSPELIAKYCDEILNARSRYDEEEAEEEIEHLLRIFKHVEDKDIFQEIYRKLLAKRLIFKTSVSEYLEGHVISQLRQVCGHEYTSKITRMFNDMAFSRDLTEEFKDQTSRTFKYSYDILVLSTVSWPVKPTQTNFIMPKHINYMMEDFSRFFTRKFDSSRVLTWIWQFSKGELKASFGGNSYTLQCSAFQIGILMLFNDQEVIDFNELKEALDLKETHLKRSLLSLLRLRVLHKAPRDEPTITNTSRFKINKKFSSQKRKVQLNIPVREEMQEQQEENEKERKALLEYRKLQLQAAIIRVMKQERSIEYTALTGAVIELVKENFTPKVPAVKKCIDVLIEKEYIARREGKKDIIEYVS